MCIYVYVYEEGEGEEERIYFKELAYPVMEAGKSKIYRVGQQAENLGKSQCCCSSSMKAIY